eukprot:2053306-Amphidinium_carterae.2
MFGRCGGQELGERYNYYSNGIVYDAYDTGVEPLNRALWLKVSNPEDNVATQIIKIFSQVVVSNESEVQGFLVWFGAAMSARSADTQ